MRLAGFGAFRFLSIEFRGSGFGFIHWVCGKVFKGLGCEICGLGLFVLALRGFRVYGPSSLHVSSTACL